MDGLVDMSPEVATDDSLAGIDSDVRSGWFSSSELEACRVCLCLTDCEDGLFNKALPADALPIRLDRDRSIGGVDSCVLARRGSAVLEVTLSADMPKLL